MDNRPHPGPANSLLDTRAAPRVKSRGIEQVNARLNMKVFSRLWTLALVALGFAAGTPARAQFLSLDATNSRTSLAVSNSLTYTIGVTNLTAQQIGNVYVTNSFSGPYRVLDYTPTNSLLPAGSNVVFSLGPLLGLNGRQMTLTIAPDAAGILTNTVSASSTSFLVVTNVSVLTLVTNIPAQPADLAVSLTGPAGPVVEGDYFTYGAIVSNLGSNSVAGVVLTNSASTNLFLIDFTPTNQPFRITTNGFLLFDMGTLTNGAVRNISITVHRTNAGPLTLSALVGAPGIDDFNTNNNSAFTNLTILPLDTSQLIATNASALTFNPQNSLMQQTLRLVNVSTSTVASARVIVTGLGRTNWLFNAVGTNSLGTTNLNPFVVYPAPLDPGQSADLVLQYGTATRQFFHVDDTNYLAVPTSAVNLSVTALPSIALTNFLLPDSSMLIQFSATTGLTYQVQYSSDPTFNTGVLLAQPPIFAQANIVQWIDNGPPNTVSPPMSVPMRFYRVQVRP